MVDCGGPGEGFLHVDIPTLDLEIEGLPEDDSEWVVEARLGLVRNDAKQHEPGVLLLLAKGTWGGKAREARIGLSHIAIVQLHSVWRRGRFVRDLPMRRVLIHVDGSSALPVLPPDEISHMCRIRPSSYIGNRLLSQKSCVEVRNGSRRFLIPTLELFSRCYGHSEYVRGRLATLPFKEALQALLARDVVAAQPGRWLLTLDMHCYDDDALFLAHLKHDAHTQARVRSMCGAFQAASVASVGKGPVLVSPPVQPWWKGKVTLECLGVDYAKEPGTFMVFRIDGMSQPKGPSIDLDRQNTNAVEYDDLKPDRSTLAGGWRPPYKNAVAPEPDRLVHTQEPSRDFALRYLQNPRLKILGPVREIVRVVRTVQKPTSRSHRESEPHPTALSSGPETGAGTERPAPMSIATPTDAIVRGVWAALHVVVAADYPGACVRTWDGLQWVGSQEPIGVAILQPDVQHAHSWYSIRTGHRSRCFYWARVLLATGTVNILEIERRYSNGVATEEMCGVGFAVGDLSEVLEICRVAKEQKGVLTGIPLAVTLFRHRHDKKGTFEAAVRTLLTRLGHPPSVARETARASNPKLPPGF